MGWNKLSKSEQCSANLFLKAFKYLFHELPRQPVQHFPSCTFRNLPFISHLNLSCSILGPFSCVPSTGKKQYSLLYQLFTDFLDGRLLLCLPTLFLLQKCWALFTFWIATVSYIFWQSSCFSLHSFHFIQTSGIPKLEGVLQLSLQKTQKKDTSDCEPFFMPHNPTIMTTHYHLLIYHHFRSFSEKILLYSNFSSFICTADIPT